MSTKEFHPGIRSWIVRHGSGRIMVKSTSLLVTVGVALLLLLLVIPAAIAEETGVQANDYPPAALSETASGSIMKKTVAAFSGTPRNGPAPLNVQFSDASTGTITSYAWDFGDGNTSQLKNPSH